jgi:hypothetical protein
LLTVLDQVPFIAKRILKNGDGAVVLDPRFLQEMDVPAQERLVVAVKIIGLQKQKNATAGLPPYGRALFIGGRFGQQQAGLRCTLGRHQDPSLAGGELGVFKQIETQRSDIEVERFIVAGDDQAYGGDTLFNGLP